MDILARRVHSGKVSEVGSEEIDIEKDNNEEISNEELKARLS